MFEPIKTRPFLGIMAALLLGTSLARAEFGAILDNGAFFSEPAKSEASRNITEIGKRFKKDLVIETFKEIPEEVKKGVNLADKAALNRLFEEWTVRQARQLKVNGVYILLSRDPAHLQIVVGNDTQNQAFTLRDRENLASTMLAKLRGKKNDEALVEGVNFVLSTMASHAVPRNHANSGSTPLAAASGNGNRAGNSSPWGWIIAVVVVLGGIWLVVAVLRAMFRGGASPGGVGTPPVTGGGGFFSSLLGGMFGAAAGMWLYDQFSGSHGSAWGADQDNRGSGDSGFSGQDTDYSGSGGDFSDDSGGGDSGADFGGGDSSGGGGDF